ncbi:MAG: threonylcarbamoyl-AMP synthase [Fidelibacterota bacterium]|nr:MAG: threonylcarbamoyl-AMP synthase [Candidatus Neomarinimicrobiota bacterium]
MIRVAASDPTAVTIFWQIIRSGGLVAYPTDTLYGLGADAFSQSAAARIAAVKGRGGPFSVMVGDLDQLGEYALVSAEIADKLVGMLPGPYTIVLSPIQPERLAPVVEGPGERVGFRIPDHAFIQAAYQRDRGVVISTSVNRTGEPPLQNPDDIQKLFSEEIDLLVDAGSLPHSLGSTVVDPATEPWRVIRQGDGRL